MADTEIISENEAGLLEFRDAETGDLKATQKPQRQMAQRMAEGKKITKKLPYDLVKTEGGKMVADPESVLVVGRARGKTVYPYNITTAQAIVEYLCEGMTLRQIAQMKAIPPVSTIRYWATQHKEFKHAMDEAKIVRGEQFADEAVDVARKTTSMTSRKDKLKIDTLKWAAKVDNPEKFGDSVTHKGDAAHPITIVVDTGIRRNLG